MPGPIHIIIHEVGNDLKCGLMLLIFHTKLWKIKVKHASQDKCKIYHPSRLTKNIRAMNWL